MLRAPFHSFIEKPAYVQGNPAVLSTTRGVYIDVQALNSVSGIVVAAPFIYDWRIGISATDDYYTFENTNSYSNYGYSYYNRDEATGLHFSRKWYNMGLTSDSLAIGFSYQMGHDRWRSFDAGFLWYLPQKTTILPVVIGAYGASRSMDGEESLDLEFKVSNKSKTVSGVISYSVLGDDREYARLEYPVVRGLRRLGVVVQPANWLSFSYSRLVGGESEYRLGFKYLSSGIVSNLGVEMIGIQSPAEGSGRNADKIGLNIHAGFFGGYYKQNNRDVTMLEYHFPPVTPEVSGDTLSTLEKLRLYQYREQRIGAFRGLVLPLVSTFSVFGTFLLPLGTNNMIVGNYETGFYFLAAEVVGAIVIYNSSDWLTDKEGRLSMVWLTFIGLKIWDYFIAREYVNEYNKKLGIQLLMAPTQNMDGAKVGVTVDF